MSAPARSPRPAPDRCRIVLILPEELPAEAAHDALAQAFEGGDVASVIIPPHAMGERAYSDHLKALTPLIQARGAAAVAVRDLRLASRIGMDGVHLDGDMDELEDVLARAEGRLTVGTERPRTRDQALEFGELEPGYVMFGSVTGDTHEAPHSKNLDLAEWWASMIEIPSIIMAGTDLDAVVECAETGAEFVGLSRAVFANPARTREMVSRANTMLDENAPRWETAR